MFQVRFVEPSFITQGLQCSYHQMGLLVIRQRMAATYVSRRAMAARYGRSVVGKRLYGPLQVSGFLQPDMNTSQSESLSKVLCRAQACLLHSTTQMGL